MNNIENELAVAILDNSSLPLRIEIEEKERSIFEVTARDIREIKSIRKERGLYLDDYYYIKSKDFPSFSSYVIGNIRVGEPIPTEEEIKKYYESLPWEEIIYVCM